MENNYYEVQISYNKENYDELYNKLYLEGITNILEENGILKIYFGQEHSDEINMLEKNLLKNKIISKKDFSVEKLESKNWNAEWESSIEPVILKTKL